MDENSKIEAFHKRADHEDDLFVSRTGLFMSFNGFMAVAVNLVNPNERNIRIVFAVMAIALNVFWAIWAPRARTFIYALRQAGRARADQVLWENIIGVGRRRWPRITTLMVLMPWLLLIGWSVVVYFLLKAH
jgi:hypothetical protein